MKHCMTPYKELTAWKVCGNLSLLRMMDKVNHLCGYCCCREGLPAGALPPLFLTLCSTELYIRKQTLHSETTSSPLTLSSHAGPEPQRARTISQRTCCLEVLHGKCVCVCVGGWSYLPLKPGRAPLADPGVAGGQDEGWRLVPWGSHRQGQVGLGDLSGSHKLNVSHLCRGHSGILH